MQRRALSILEESRVAILVSILGSGGSDQLFTPGVKADLPLLAALLLAHVLPTFFLPFRHFDKRVERVQGWIYAHLGPWGFGIFIGAMIRNIILEHSDLNLQHGTTASSALLGIIATSVALSYWSSSTMTKEAQQEDFAGSNCPAHLRTIILFLREQRESTEAAVGIGFYLSYNLEGLMQWLKKVEPLLDIKNNPSLGIILLAAVEEVKQLQSSLISKSGGKVR